VLRASVHAGTAASRHLLVREGRRAGLIHIAAHGRFRPDAPLFSHVELADGPLTTAEIFNLKLNAGLVTLSAARPVGRCSAAVMSWPGSRAPSFMRAPARCW
jgi:CHAT domain-containing protein